LVPNLVILETFECAARYGSFTQAALELNLTQSAVSRHIKELEGRLGVLLFERVRQRVNLSDDGRRLLPEARRLLEDAEDAMMRFITGVKFPHQLNLLAPPTFVSHWMMPRLHEFLAQHPDIAVRVSCSLKLFAAEPEAIHIATTCGRPAWGHAVCRQVVQEELYPVASRELVIKAHIDGLVELLN